MSSRAAAVVALAFIVATPLGADALLGGDGIPAYDRLAEHRELAEDFEPLEKRPPGRSLFRIDLDAEAALSGQECSEVVGLGLLALANQLG